MGGALSGMVGVCASTGLTALRSHGVPDEAVHKNFASLMNRAASLVAKHEAGIAEAQADRNLSPEGRASKQHEATRALRAAFAALHREEVTPLVEWASAKRSKLVDAGRLRRSDDRNEVMLEEMRHAELRRHVYATDPVTWQAQYAGGQRRSPCCNGT